LFIYLLPLLFVSCEFSSYLSTFTFLGPEEMSPEESSMAIARSKQVWLNDEVLLLNFLFNARFATMR